MPPHRFPKGVSGNPNGRPKKEYALQHILEEHGEKLARDPKNSKRKAAYKQLLAEKLWTLAVEKGDPVIIKYLFDRIEGPVANIHKILDPKDDAPDEAMEFIRSDLIRLKQYVNNTWYVPAGFHREVANAISDPTKRRLIITLPPQFGKSELLCKTFPAWFLGNNPDKTVIVGTYNQEYANKLSVQCRDFLNSPRFQEAFGDDIKLHPEQQTKHEWMLANHKGGCIFSGVGGTVTGNPADVFLIDDVTKDFEEACSKAVQEKIWNWYNSVVQSRLQGEESRIIIVMTRWTKNDLVGKILAQEEELDIPHDERFEVIHYPAILDVKDNDFEKGRSLWPEKKSMKFLLERQRKAPAMFLAIWQGNPRDLDGLVIKPEWIRYEDDPKSLGELVTSCRGWDFGYTETGDETVGARIDVYRKGESYRPVLSSVVSCRMDPTRTKEFVIETALRDGPTVTIGVEGGGTQVAMAKAIADRKELMDYQTKIYIPKLDKVARAITWILKLEDGVFQLARGPWNQMVAKSLTDFSNNCEHDDVEDAITTAWKVIWGDKE